MKWLHIYLLVAESVINPGALEPQHVSLLLHLNGFDTGRFGHGVRAAFARFPFDGPSTSTQRDLPDSCLDLLIDAAHNVGFADRVPRVRGIPDTSDYSANIDVSVRLDPQTPSRVLSFSMQSMGYRGVDAPALAAFFGTLCEVCGLDAAIRDTLCACETD